MNKKTNHEPKPVSSWLQDPRKRKFDVLAASGLLALSAPVITVAALAILVKDRHNPFFVQQRLGQGGKPFNIYKLRTLGAQAHDGIGQGPQDVRATTVGRFLRTYGIDELPQLVSILKGDMSFAGARPITPAERARMQQVLTPAEFMSWETAYTAGWPGLVSEYAIATRFVPPDVRDTPDHYRSRAHSDVRYAQEASPRVDAGLYKSTLALAKALGAKALGLQSDAPI